MKNLVYNTKNGLKIFKNIVSNDESRPVMGGAYHNASGDIVACDGHKLVLLKGANNDVSMYDKIVNIKTGEFIEGDYPKYENVIPQNIIIFKKDVSELLNVLETKLNKLSKTEIKDLRRYPSNIKLMIELNVGLHSQYFNPLFLYDVLSLLVANGGTELQFEFSLEKQWTLLIRDTKTGNIGLVCSVSFDENIEIIQYTFELSKDQIIELIDYMENNAVCSNEKYYLDKLNEEKAKTEKDDFNLVYYAKNYYEYKEKRLNEVKRLKEKYCMS